MLRNKKLLFNGMNEKANFNLSCEGTDADIIIQIKALFFFDGTNQKLLSHRNTLLVIS